MVEPAIDVVGFVEADLALEFLAIVAVVADLNRGSVAADCTFYEAVLGFLGKELT